MEEWYSAVRKLRDESLDAYSTEKFTHHVFQSLKRLKVKDKGKFKQRMGPEFSSWSAGLEIEFGKPLVVAILNDDTFWELTLHVALK